MGLETGTYINDLVVTNPVGATDPKSQGDDHLRLIKTVLKSTFPGLVGSAFRLQTKTSDYELAISDNMSVLLCTAALELTLPDADSLGNKQMTVVVSNGAGVTLTPTGADTVNGASSLTLSFSQAAIIFCDGDSEYFAVLIGGTSSNFTTGDIKHSIRTEANTEPGWIIAAGTIGDASSGATNRANADCEALFLMHWDGLADGQAAVSGGRGASAAADWAAHKTIAVVNLRGVVIAGRDNMLGSAAGKLTGTVMSPDGQTVGAIGGAQTHVLSLAEMPSHAHDTGSEPFTYTPGGGGPVFSANTYPGTSAWTTSSNGSYDPHLNTQATIVMNAFIKL